VNIQTIDHRTHPMYVHPAEIPWIDREHPHWNNPPSKWLSVSNERYDAFHRWAKALGVSMRSQWKQSNGLNAGEEARLWWGTTGRKTAGQSNHNVADRDVLCATYWTAAGTRRVLNMQAPIVQAFLGFS
jgi:hypothetical protein